MKTKNKSVKRSEQIMQLSKAKPPVLGSGVVISHKGYENRLIQQISEAKGGSRERNQ